MRNNYLEIENVDFIIGGKTKVKDVSFSIENEGETLCILGPSGIGKTTILRTIAGLEKINKGSIKLNNKLLSSKEKNGAVKLTTAEYFTPSGKSIQAKGINPDIILDQKNNDKDS